MQKPEMRVALVPDYQECVLWCGGRKLSFVCTLPLDQEMQWNDVHGNTVDDRLTPELPNLEVLRPLRTLSKEQWQAAKKRAFGVLQKARGDALKKIEDAQREPTFL